MPDKIHGGKADKLKGKLPKGVSEKQLQKGIKVEMEHTDDPSLAREIALDHLTEFSDYYDRLEKMENKKANIDIINPEDSSISGMHMIGGGDFQTAQYASPQRDMANDDKDGFEIDFDKMNDLEPEEKPSDDYYVMLAGMKIIKRQPPKHTVRIGPMSFEEGDRIKNGIARIIVETMGFLQVKVSNIRQNQKGAWVFEYLDIDGDESVAVVNQQKGAPEANYSPKKEEWESSTLMDKSLHIIKACNFDRIPEKKAKLSDKIAIGLTDVPSAGVPQNMGLSREMGDGEAVDLFGAPSELVDTHPINNKYQNSVNNSTSSEEAYFSYLYDLNHDENIGILNDLKDTFYYSRANMVKKELVKLAQAMENSKAVREVSELLSGMGWEKTARTGSPPQYESAGGTDSTSDTGVTDTGMVGETGVAPQTQTSPKPAGPTSSTSVRLQAEKYADWLASGNDPIFATFKSMVDSGIIRAGGDIKSNFSVWVGRTLKASGMPIVHIDSPNPNDPEDDSKARGILNSALRSTMSSYSPAPTGSPTAGARQLWNDGGTGFARYYPNERAGRAMMDAWEKGKPEGSGSDVRSYMRWLQEQGISEYGQALEALRKAAPASPATTTTEESDRPKTFRESLDQIAKIYANRLQRDALEKVPGSEFNLEDAIAKVRDWMLDNLTPEQIVKVTTFTEGDQAQAIEELVPGAWDALQKAIITEESTAPEEPTPGGKPSATVETADGRRTVDLATPEGQKAFATSFMAKLRKDPKLIDVKGRIGEGRATARRVKWLLTRAGMSSGQLIEEIARRGGHMLSDEMAVDVIKQLVREARGGSAAEDNTITAASKRQQDILRVLGRK